MNDQNQKQTTMTIQQWLKYVFLNIDKEPELTKDKDIEKALRLMSLITYFNNKALV